jgi:MarR family transcriptional regulator, organic hydroperoxide resistance regulator
MSNKEINAYIERISNLMPSFAKSMSNVGAVDMSIRAITMPQIAVMNYIEHNSFCKVSDISKFFTVKLSSATGMVDRLEKEKYVNRKKDKNDNRIVRLNLTAGGKNILSKMMKIKREHAAYILKALSKNERDCLVGLMEKIANSVKFEKGDKKK